LICAVCGNEMIFKYEYTKGRHKRKLYACNCGFKYSKKIATLPNNITKKGYPVKKPYTPWGKAKHARTNPKKKKRRHK